MFWRAPTKRTTPGQLTVIVAAMAAVLLVGGGYLLYLSFGQPADKLDLAMWARSVGVKLIVAGCVTGTLAWLGHRFFG